MTWSGKDAALDRWLPQFHDPNLCRQEIDKYIQGARVLDDQRCDKFVARGLERDQELAAIADPEDYAIGPSRYDLNGCYHCYGRGFVRLDLDKYDAEFGKAKPCPACHGRDRDHSAHCSQCAEFRSDQVASGERTRCYQCARFEDEPAAEICGNPEWHWPNWTVQAVEQAGTQRDYVAELAGQMSIR